MKRPRQSSLTIETPEGVVFSYEIAMPAARALAWCVDAAAIAVMSQTVTKLGQTLGKVNADFAGALSVIYTLHPAAGGDLRDSVSCGAPVAGG